MYKISVIVPTYNRASLLKRCLKSIFAQGYDNLELIVVNDGSTDGTAEYLKSVNDFSEQKVIAFHLKENQGLPHALNVGAENATGDILMHIDDDDWYWWEIEMELGLW